MSNSKRKIAVVTGSRADYGLLYWLLYEIKQDPALELQVIVTGMHLSPEFGSTYKEIENDGFEITCKVDSLVSSDSFRRTNKIPLNTQKGSVLSIESFLPSSCPSTDPPPSRV